MKDFGLLEALQCRERGQIGIVHWVERLRVVLENLDVYDDLCGLTRIAFVRYNLVHGCVRIYDRIRTLL